MVPSSNTQASEEVVYKGPDGGLGLKGCERAHEHSTQGNENDNNSVKPVDVLGPICKGEWLFGDVDLNFALGFNFTV